jgi:transposase
MRKKKNNKRFETPRLNMKAAGIDIAASSDHYVAVSPECCPDNVRCFGHFTEDLHQLADWLLECGIETVAMESTGVYWIPIYQVLEARGLEIFLVNSRHIKNVPGRKSDVQDCQWLQYLHSVGLLRGSFRPKDEICALRSIQRHKDSLVKLASSHTLRMQKSLDQMNIKLHYVISDITGESGLKIIKAILDGERDPLLLAKLKNHLIRASETTIAKALVGDYRQEHLFTLRQSLSAYENYQILINECDEQMHKMMAKIDDNELHQHPLPKPTKGKRDLKPLLRKEMYRLLGVDLTAINGISSQTAYAFYTEVGPNLDKFRTEKHFTSWLGLCPGKEETAGKIKSSKTRKVANRFSIKLRIAASTLHHAKSDMGQYFRRMKTKLGAPKAITATAAKIARIIYFMIKNKVPFDQTQFQKNEELFLQRRIKNLKRNAAELGLKLIENEEAVVVVP